MDLIVSRRFGIPRSKLDLEDEFYFNVWKNRWWPFDALRDGATLFLYESPTQVFVWKVKARHVRAMEYETLGLAYDWLHKHYGEFDHNQAYLEEPATRGYCLAFTCDPIELLDLPKPKGLRIPMLGWTKDQNFIKACGLK